MEIKNLWPLVERTIRVVAGQYEPAIPGAIAQFGLDPALLSRCLLAAKTFEPDPVTVERLRVRAPYTSPKLYAEQLANAAAAGFLRPVEADSYILTVKADQAITASFQTISDCLARWSPLPAKQLARLAALLWKLVEASLAVPEPPVHWCLAHSRRLDPGSGAAHLVRIDQYLSDLGAYRDDAHLASWQGLGVDGPAWDALTCLWHESPLSPDEIATKLKRRGWNRSEYESRLEALALKGWVDRTGNVCKISPAGSMVRQQAEDRTDDFFCRSWECLSKNGLEELEILLNRILLAEA